MKFKNCTIFTGGNPILSTAVQHALFAIGYGWVNSGKVVAHEDEVEFGCERSGVLSRGISRTNNHRFDLTKQPISELIAFLEAEEKPAEPALDWIRVGDFDAKCTFYHDRSGVFFTPAGAHEKNTIVKARDIKAIHDRLFPATRDKAELERLGKVIEEQAEHADKYRAELASAREEMERLRKLGVLLEEQRDEWKAKAATLRECAEAWKAIAEKQCEQWRIMCGIGQRIHDLNVEINPAFTKAKKLWTEATK